MRDARKTRRNRAPARRGHVTLCIAPVRPIKDTCPVTRENP